MSWQQDLEIVVARYQVERYRWLTSDQNSDVVARDRYRAEMTRMAHEPDQPRPAVVMASSRPRTAPAFHPCCGGFDPMALDPE